MKQYSVHTFKLGLFSGALSPQKLTEVLNEHAKRGWSLARTVNTRKRTWLLITREVHMLIFEKDE